MTRVQKFSLGAGATVLLALGALAGAAERAPADTNKDGSLDFAEMQARRSDITIEQFNAMDKDHNGQLSRDEMRAVARERMQARADERFKKLDTNGDGGLSQQELSAAREQAASERFKKLDINGDGKLTEDEMQAGRAFGERRGRMGPGPHRGEPPATP